MSTAAKTTPTKPAPAPSNVVALPSMTHSLAHLPTMSTVDPRCLHYGGLGASKEASQAKLQQTLQRRDTASTFSSAPNHHPPPPLPNPPRKPADGDYLMMRTARKK